MSLNAVKILKISVTTNSKNKILEFIQKYLFTNAKVKAQKSKIIKIFTPNTEQVVFAQKNPWFGEILNRADIAIPDSVGVSWAGHMLTKNGPEKPIPGVEFMEDLVSFAANHHVPIGLIGGKGNVAVETLDCLQKKYPGLSGWAEDGPEIQDTKMPDDIYFSRLGRRIVREGTQIVFVALGPPKQELFIERLAREVPRGIICMAVGGSFDIISGRLQRAPAMIRSLGFEWLWRLLLEPRRIFRQLALIEFVLLVLKEKLRG